MKALLKVLRDPLLHFLVAGAALFAAHGLIHPGDTTGTGDGKRIVVDRAALTTFLQYQSAAFQPKYFEAQFDGLTADGRKALIDKYVQEEALVREARAMGLDQGDYVIRRRMVQKMMYLMDDTASETFSPSDAELKRYYDAHPDAYRGPATVTFTHVFLDNEAAHPGGAQKAAEAMRLKLEARRAGFSDGPAHGDRFAYLQNYIDRTPDFVGGQFGPGFQAALAKLEPSSRWQGPIRSDYGWHLVLLTDRRPAELPPFATVREQVKDDLLRETIAAYRKKAIADLAARFEVTLKDLPKPRPGHGAHPILAAEVEDGE
jgi:hypothetical protein